MSAIPSLGNYARQPWQPGCLFQEAEQSVKLMIDSVAAAELDTVRKRHKEVLQVIVDFIFYPEFLVFCRKTMS